MLDTALVYLHNHTLLLALLIATCIGAIVGFIEWLTQKVKAANFDEDKLITPVTYPKKDILVPYTPTISKERTQLAEEEIRKISEMVCDVDVAEAYEQESSDIEFEECIPFVQLMNEWRVFVSAEYTAGTEYYPGVDALKDGKFYRSNGFMNQDSIFSVGPNLGQWTLLY